MGVEESGRTATINFLDAVTLTGSFVESGEYRISPFAQIELILDYTMDAGEADNDAILKVLLSEDGTNYHEYSIADDGDTATDGVIEAILYARRFVIEGEAGVKVTRWYAIPTSAKWIKVAAMERGITSEGGILTVKARVSNDLEDRS